MSTFFFTEIPEYFRAKVMYATFEDFRDIGEVIIPQIRYNGGKIFGFARFNNVMDENMMAIKLDNIIICTRKIYEKYSKVQERDHKRFNIRED